MSGPSQPPGEGFTTPKKHRSRRRRGSLHSTPRSAAYSLGRQRPEPEIDTQGTEMNLFGSTSPRSLPIRPSYSSILQTPSPRKSFPKPGSSVPSAERAKVARALKFGSTDEPEQNIEMKSFGASLSKQTPSDKIQEVVMTKPLGVVHYTNSIEEDLTVLEEYGFIIDYPRGFLGSGLHGQVFKGVYGQKVTQLKDKEGQPLRNVGPGMPFAAKLVDFSKENPDDEQSTRDSFELEKKVLTWVDHPNIVPIRMCINMGEPREYTKLDSDGPPVKYIQHQRVYLIMDFAKLGSLKKFLERKRDRILPMERVKLTQCCFWGLKYLHEKGIEHGDLHIENVLIFPSQTGVVAKLSDFGLGYVSKNCEFIPSSQLDDETFPTRIQVDCSRLYSLVHNIWKGFKIEQILTNDETLKRVCSQFVEFEKEMRNAKTLDEVLSKYQEILNWRRTN